MASKRACDNSDTETKRAMLEDPILQREVSCTQIVDLVFLQEWLNACIEAPQTPDVIELAGLIENLLTALRAKKMSKTQLQHAVEAAQDSSLEQRALEERRAEVFEHRDILRELLGRKCAVRHP